MSLEVAAANGGPSSAGPMELPQHQDDDLEVPLKLRDPLTEQHVGTLEVTVDDL